MDPGRYTYAEGDPNLRHWFRGTAAHNTVTVDGQDQTPVRAQPLLAAERQGDVPRPRRTACSRARSQSPCYDAVHRRRVVFVQERYWIVEDTLTGDRSHRYDLHWHLPPEAQDLTHVHGGVAVAPGLTLAILGARSVALEDGLDQPRVRRSSTPRRSSARPPSAPHARFVTLLAPREPGAPAPTFFEDGDTLFVGDDRITLP